MKEWDMMIVADQLKEKQNSMQKSHTKTVDALQGIRDELISLRGIWQGYACDEFMAAFFQKWEEACDESERVGNLITAFVRAEKVFEDSEAKIGELL